MDYTAYVDPRQGTDSTMTFSRGNTLPVVSTPFGMNAWVLETFGYAGDHSNWFYSPHHRVTRGLRCSHQPSPWIGDYACFRLFAQTGDRDLTDRGLSSSFSPEQTTIAPSCLDATLHRFGVRMQLAPTRRGAVGLLRFPRDARRRVIVRVVHGSAAFALLPDGRTLLATFATPASGARDDLRFHLALRSSQPVAELLRFGDAPWQRVATDPFAQDDRRMDVTGGGQSPAGASIELTPRPASAGARSGADDEITLHLATSYISCEQALVTLEREILPLSFADAERAARAEWNVRLGRLRVDTLEESALRTFTSCLYRAQLYPNFTDEVDSDGRTVHRSFYDGGVHAGPMVTNNGFWDTYRTVYPFLSLAYPATLVTILNGWLNASREGGWTPKWPAPGHRGTMIGTHLEAVFADAYTKGIAGWDAAEAYQIARRNAFDAPPEGAPYGRVGLANYLTLGYVPEDRVGHAASRTMDFAYGDFCLAQMACGLGIRTDADELSARASRWRAIYDPQVGFLRGRRADGSYAPGFDPFLWGGPYVEGSAWQCGLAVYHEPLALGDLLAAGGPAAPGGDSMDARARHALEARLDALFNAPPLFDSGHYQSEIHEMSEMAAVDFGQYAHSNQPSHHIPFLYTVTDSPWKADHTVRSVLEQLYDSSPAGFCGDEDNGEMSCWYLLAAMGLYQICPGKPEYSLTAPLFEEIVLEPEDAEPLRIIATGASRNARFLASAELNGEPLDRAVEYDSLRRGGVLSHTLSRVPQIGDGRPDGPGAASGRTPGR